PPAALPDLACDAAPACGRLGVGPSAPRPGRRRVHIRRRRRLVGGRFPRGLQPGRPAPRAGDLPAPEQPPGDIHACARPDRRAYLEDAGILREGDEQRMQAEIEAQVAAALAAAEARAEAPPAQIFDHVYSEPPARLLAQRRALTGEDAENR